MLATPQGHVPGKRPNHRWQNLAGGTPRFYMQPTRTQVSARVMSALGPSELCQDLSGWWETAQLAVGSTGPSGHSWWPSWLSLSSTVTILSRGLHGRDITAKKTVLGPLQGRGTDESELLGDLRGRRVMTEGPGPKPGG